MVTNHKKVPFHVIRFLYKNRRGPPEEAAPTDPQSTSARGLSGVVPRPRASPTSVLAHRRAVRFFATLDYEPCHEELCQLRGAFFFQHRARIGLAGAQAAALRMGSHSRPHVGARPQPPRSFYADLPRGVICVATLPSF